MADRSSAFLPSLCGSGAQTGLLLQNYHIACKIRQLLRR